MSGKQDAEKSDEIVELEQSLKETEEHVEKISKQWTLLKHEYRSTRDKTLKEEIKKKWDKLQEEMDTAKKRRRKIIEEKNEIEFKKKWKGWK